MAIMMKRGLVWLFLSAGWLVQPAWSQGQWKRPDNSGKSVYGYTFTDMEGRQVDLVQFKGKKLYIELWFSACKPCIKEMTYARELHLKMTDPEVIFVSISTDIYEKDWRKALEKHQPPGIHLWTAGLDNRKRFVDAFDQHIYPTYWLVDEEGIIIDSNAWRPSEYLEKGRLPFR